MPGGARCRKDGCFVIGCYHHRQTALAYLQKFCFHFHLFISLFLNTSSYSSSTCTLLFDMICGFVINLFFVIYLTLLGDIKMCLPYFFSCWVIIYVQVKLLPPVCLCQKHLSPKMLNYFFKKNNCFLGGMLTGP